MFNFKHIWQLYCICNNSIFKKAKPILFNCNALYTYHISESAFSCVVLSYLKFDHIAFPIEHKAADKSSDASLTHPLVDKRLDVLSCHSEYHLQELKNNNRENVVRFSDWPMSFYENVGKKLGLMFLKSRAKVGTLLLKSRDSRAIFLLLHRQIR